MNHSQLQYCFCNAQSFNICPHQNTENESERSCWSSTLSCTAWMTLILAGVLHTEDHHGTTHELKSCLLARAYCARSCSLRIYTSSSFMSMTSTHDPWPWALNSHAKACQPFLRRQPQLLWVHAQGLPTQHHDPLSFSLSWASCCLSWSFFGVSYFSASSLCCFNSHLVYSTYWNSYHS
jgi:hypothetical protein